MLTPSQDHCLRVIAASLIEIAGYMKLNTRDKLSYDEMGFQNRTWNKEVQDRKDTFYAQLADAVDAEAN